MFWIFQPQVFCFVCNYRFERRKHVIISFWKPILECYEVAQRSAAATRKNKNEAQQIAVQKKQVRDN